jgi:DNA-binding NarL/FixJ family response regulator
MSKIKVVLIEDEEEIRKGYEFLINSSGDFSCTGYKVAEKAIANLHADQPEVVLMDVNLPGMNGIEATKILKEMLPSLQIMMFTIYENNENVFDALSAGASGYILKQTKPEKLLEAIKEVYNGGAPMSSQIAKMVVNTFHRHHQSESALTEREQEILELLAAGYRNKDVADKLYISLSTVKSHVYAIYQKLHVTSRVEAVNKMNGRNRTN